MTQLPLTIAVGSSLIAGCLFVSLVAGRCALHELLRICLV
jgi:hypothetical protein